MTDTLSNTDLTKPQIGSELKLPSADVVTAENLWQLVQDIAATSDKFTQQQLQTKTKLPKNTTKRVLAYLKYLHLLEESRKDETQGVKKVKVQYFTVNKRNELVEKVQYELKANRKDSAIEAWNELIRKHEMASIILKEFFGASSSKTKIDLENFLKSRKELEGHNPDYYLGGVGFIVRILTQAGVISNKGNDLFLTSSHTSPEDDEAFQSLEHADDTPTTKITAKYKVSISGPGLNTTMEIQEELDIVIVEKYLAKIRSKFSPPPTSESHEDTKSPA